MSATGNCRLNNHRFIETKLLICSLISTFPLITFRQRLVIIVPETEENILFCARYGGDTKIIYILNSEFSESKNYSFISPSSQSSTTNTAGNHSKLRFGPSQSQISLFLQQSFPSFKSKQGMYPSITWLALRPLNCSTYRSLREKSSKKSVNPVI